MAAGACSESVARPPQPPQYSAGAPFVAFLRVKGARRPYGQTLDPQKQARAVEDMRLRPACLWGCSSCLSFLSFRSRSAPPDPSSRPVLLGSRPARSLARSGCAFFGSGLCLGAVFFWFARRALQLSAVSRPARFASASGAVAAPVSCIGAGCLGFAQFRSLPSRLRFGRVAVRRAVASLRFRRPDPAASAVAYRNLRAIGLAAFLLDFLYFMAFFTPPFRPPL